MPNKQILVCVHDVTPKHTDRLERIHRMLHDVGVGDRYSMLVVPNFWGEWPLEEHPEFCDWLKARAADGVEMILHGFYHRDTTEHTGAIAKFKATTFTASEGEFLGLTYDDAYARIADGRARVEAVLDAPVSGFVAPAWLYSEGTRAALRDHGFTVAEDQLSVWRPDTGRVVHRSPVVGYASRDRRRIAGSMVWSRTATAALRPLPVVRQAIHPHDFDVQLLEDEIRRALGSFLRRRRPMYYRELVA